MHTRLIWIPLMSLMLVSCAESVHQQERMGFEQERSRPQAVPALSYINESQPSPPVYGTTPVKLQLSQGQSVTMSGLVLQAKRLEGFTEIEILQLPAGADSRPTEDRRQSQGRFLARQTTFLDPAILATKPMVTITGVVEAEVERPLEPGSDNYAYHVVAIQELTIWPQELIEPYAGSLAQPGGTTAFSQPDMETDFMSNFLGAILRGLGQILFSPNRHDYRSPYNSSYSSSHSSSSSSASPSPPPEKDIPPQFRKGH